MDPAVLADLIRRVHVDPLTRMQPLHQLAAKLCFVVIVCPFGFQLRQPLVCSADHQVAHPYALATQA